MQNDMRDRLVELIEIGKLTSCDVCDKNGSYECDDCENNLIAEYLMLNDVVPVVRCKDCIHCKPIRTDVFSCKHWNTHRVYENDYCSYGERK